MQFSILINQSRAVEWGLNSQQSILFSFVYQIPSWARPVNQDDGFTYYAISKQKICEELPILTDKPDTAWRMLRQLEDAGLIVLSHTASITLVRLTQKARMWNSDKIPSEVGKKSEEGRKKIRGWSEKNPTNQVTNQVTNQEEPSVTAGRRPDDCPYQEIADLYNKVTKKALKDCLELNDKRKRNIRKCWDMKIKGKQHFRSMEFWEQYFVDCTKNPHWRGENQRGWKADIEFVTRADTVLTVLEA